MPLKTQATPDRLGKTSIFSRLFDSALIPARGLRGVGIARETPVARREVEVEGVTRPVALRAARPCRTRDAFGLDFPASRAGHSSPATGAGPHPAPPATDSCDLSRLSSPPSPAPTSLPAPALWPRSDPHGRATPDPRSGSGRVSPDVAIPHGKPFRRTASRPPARPVRRPARGPWFEAGRGRDRGLPRQAAGPSQRQPTAGLQALG